MLTIPGSLCLVFSGSTEARKKEPMVKCSVTGPWGQGLGTCREKLCPTTNTQPPTNFLPCLSCQQEPWWREDDLVDSL